MPYSPPTITAAGLQTNTYASILQYLVSAFQNIYGPNCYLGADSADYQDISIRALQNNDLENALTAVYLSFNPLTAIGTSLDLLGNLIGVPRKPATYSTATVTITGTPYANIFNGIAQDTSGNYWNLPAQVTIGNTGIVTVSVTAQNLGAVSAAAGAISIIATPTLGWSSVTNPAAASTGVPAEADSAYRARLIISQAQPSLTTIAGTAAALASLYGVTRSQVYENPRGSTQTFGLVNTSGTSVALVAASGYAFDSTLAGQSININGVVYTVASVGGGTSLTLTSSAGAQTGVPFFTVLGGGTYIGPGHSVSCVVEGGSSANIALAIYNNRGLGCYTNGTTSVAVTDPNNGNLTAYMNYYPLAYTPVYVTLTVKPLAGFTAATQSAIATNIINYLNSLSIGEAVVYSELYGAALTARPNPDQPEFSIRSLFSGTSASPAGTTDIPIAFNYAAQGISGNVTVNLV